MGFSETISKIEFWFKIPSSPKGFAGTHAADLRFVTHRPYKIRRGIQQRWVTHRPYKIRRGIQQRWVTHRPYKIRRGIQQRWKTRHQSRR